jgi:alkylation response protein AidB-like acyl-CoA dehydrogenase
MPDLDLSDEEAAWADVVERAAVHVADFEVSAAWRVLGDLGVFGIALPEHGGGPLEMAIALRALGRHAIDGPFVPSLLAAQCLPDDLRAAVVSGDCVVGMVIDGVSAWADPVIKS